MAIKVSSKEIEKLSKKDGTKKSQKAQDTIHHFTIEHAAGGHIVTHHTGEYEKEPMKHVLKSHSAIKKHLDMHCKGCDQATPEESAEMD